MEIRYNEIEDYQGNFESLDEEELNLSEGKCLFKIVVNKPDNCKIKINDIEQDSIIVDSMDIIHWEITKEGYKTSVGEFQVLNSICLILSLIPEKPKKIKKPYVKWSINDKLGYNVEIIDLSDQESPEEPVVIPSPEGKDNTFLYTLGGNLFWRRISPEMVLSPKATDDNKFLKFNTKTGFSFANILPDLPEDNKTYTLQVKNKDINWEEFRSLPEFPVEELGNTKDYTLSYLNGNLKWKLNPFQLPELPDSSYETSTQFLSVKNGRVSWSKGKGSWGSIDGSIEDQSDLKHQFDIRDLRFNTLQENVNVKLNSMQARIDSSLETVQNAVDELQERVETSVSSMENKVNSDLELMEERVNLSLDNVQSFVNETKEDLNEFSQALEGTQEAIDKNTNWITSFDVEADGFVFEDGKIKYAEGFIFPDGREMAELKALAFALKDRYATFEYFTRKQLEARLTSPDYAQMENVDLSNEGFFINTKKRYLRIESATVGDTLEVYRPLISQDSGAIIGVDIASGPITTIYRNVSGSGDIRILELTTGFYYKVSDKESMHLQFIGELPYGEFPE